MKNGWGAVLSIAAILLWFRQPFSPLKRQFRHDVSAVKRKWPKKDRGVFTTADVAHLPPPVQSYLAHCGYLNQPVMSSFHIVFNDVSLWREKDKPPLRIHYTQYNFSEEPTRLAFIDSRLFGVPFEGYDYFLNGTGGMKGVIGKLVTIFHQRGEAMNEAALVTFLAESLFLPSVLLQPYITLEPIDSTRVKATITVSSHTVTGIFVFNRAGEMTSFTTDNRSQTKSDGSQQYVKWSMFCSEYLKTEAGILFPTRIWTVWHENEADFVYFEGSVKQLIFG